MSLTGDVCSTYPEPTDNPHSAVPERSASPPILPEARGRKRTPAGRVLENIEKKTLGERVQGHKTLSLEFTASQPA